MKIYKVIGGSLIAMLLSFNVFASGNSSETLQLDALPIIGYLANAVALSALDDQTVKKIRNDLETIEKKSATRKNLLHQLNSIREATDKLLNELLEERNISNPVTSIKIRSLTNLLTLTEFIGKAARVSLKGDVTYTDHRCKPRVHGGGSDCSPKKRYNCRHTKGGCITSSPPL